MPARRALFALAAAAVAVVAVPAAAHAGNGVDLVRFMPDDTSAYVVLDVAAARDAELFKKALARLAAVAPPSFAAIEKAGFRLDSGIDTIAVGFRAWAGDGDKDNFVAVAEGKQTKLLVDLAAKDPKIRTGTYHGVPYWIDGGTAVALWQKRIIMTKTASIERAIDIALGKVKSAAKSSKTAALRAVIATADTRHQLWAAAAIPPEAATAGKQLGIEMTGVSLGASVATDLALDLDLLNASEASATAMVAQVQQALPQVELALAGTGLAASAKTLQIDREGAEVRATMTIVGGELDAIAVRLLGAPPTAP
jgi:hypothetical protein